MTATALQYISPLVKKGTKVIKRGSYGIVEGYTERAKIKTKIGNDTYNTPNFYPWEQIKHMEEWWRVN